MAMPWKATNTYIRVQAEIRPKVTGRREMAKSGGTKRSVLATLYLADGVADLNLGHVF